MSKMSALHKRACLAEYMGYRWGVFVKVMRTAEKSRAVLVRECDLIHEDQPVSNLCYRPLQKGDWRDYQSILRGGIPDYLNDLNAMSEVEACLERDGLKESYLRKLMKLTAHREGLVTVISIYNLVHASAAQKAEAAWLTLDEARRARIGKN